MLNPLQKTAIVFGVLVSMLVSSCVRTEDPGPLQEDRKTFAVMDFDRIEIGSGFKIDVEDATTFEVRVRGDRRNLNDLDVFVSGGTLIVRFDKDADRRHHTYVDIRMPKLAGVNFSGAVDAEIEGFRGDQQLDIYLSGASFCELEAKYQKTKVVLSGASKLSMEGSGDELDVELSGASELSAFNYPVRSIIADVAGASWGRVTVTENLEAVASGASRILYRGSPSVTSNVSGGSSVEKD